MSYKSKYGHTQIIPGKLHNLSINWDYDTDPSDLADRKPVLLFTPHMDNTDEHFHIELTLAQAKKLRDWLNEYCAEQFVNEYIQEQSSDSRRTKKDSV